MSSEILTFIFNTSRAAAERDKADFANVVRMITCTNKYFLSTLIFEYDIVIVTGIIAEQMFVSKSFLRRPLHNSGASQAELVTDC